MLCPFMGWFAFHWQFILPTAYVLVCMYIDPLPAAFNRLVSATLLQALESFRERRFGRGVAQISVRLSLSLVPFVCRSLGRFALSLSLSLSLAHQFSIGPLFRSNSNPNFATEVEQTFSLLSCASHFSQATVREAEGEGLNLRANLRGRSFARKTKRLGFTASLALSFRPN